MMFSSLYGLGSEIDCDVSLEPGVLAALTKASLIVAGSSILGISLGGVRICQLVS